jgi:hypothetical protein
MNLSKKQIEVIKILRENTFIYWMGGLNPSCFISGKLSYPLRTDTLFKLEDLKLIQADEFRKKFTLTELGKICELK